ncbi:hypothetical protein L1987_79429 [Smallanthus sonchifolius]|uniref:Uncharacterized protein n=1 Tax=Smallanthus sonchifolius TaxID=185202 RepID=A0ACB8ZJW0_9ASTR|nr:hypothetical protein L1987_79429 [Smallanthus sonchifolius]
MFPAHLSSSRYVNGGFSGGGCDCFISLGRGLIISDLMAEDESRTETSIDNEEAGSSMKDVSIRDHEMNAEDDDDHGRWLQLSLGGGHMTTTAEMPSVDLDLLPSGDSGSLSRQIQQPLPPSSPPPPTPPQVFFQVPEFQGHRQTSTAFWQQPFPYQTAAARNSVPFMTLQQQQQQQQYETNYKQLIRPFPANMMIAPLNPPVSSSSSFSGSSEQHGHAPHLHCRLNVARVVNPPRRPHSGIWFILQASPNQAKEPFLPQIPKSYLRIKDGRMSVGLLIKYLVNKLELGNESEWENSKYKCKNMVGESHMKETLEQTRMD